MSPDPKMYKFIGVMIFGLIAAVFADGGFEDTIDKGTVRGIQIERSPKMVYDAISAGHFGNKIGKSRLTKDITAEIEAGKSIIYSIPSTEDEDGSRVAILLEPKNDGKSTIVRLETSVPRVKQIDKPKYFADETRVARALHRTFKKYKKQLENGGSTKGAGKDVEMLLVAVDAVTNPAKQDRDLAWVLGIDSSDAGRERRTAENRIDNGAETGRAMSDARPDYDYGRPTDPTPSGY